MPERSVAIIDYGVGNLLSVRRAFEHCGAEAVISADPAVIRTAGHVVLPGVGAFGKAMQALDARGLTEVTQEVAAKGTPLLGICLGMQMLMSESEEFGLTAGLSLIPGRVTPVPARTSGGEPIKVPHVGWNALLPGAEGTSWDASILADTKPGDEVYFVHSFMAIPVDPQHRSAICLYGGNEITAVVRKDNVFGSQFHPEKSGKVGLAMLRAFLRL